MIRAKSNTIHRTYSWSPFGKTAMEDSQYPPSVCNGFSKDDSVTREDANPVIYSSNGADSIYKTPRHASIGYCANQSKNIRSISRKRRSLIQNDLTKSPQAFDSPVSKSLLNAFLQVCESQVKMNQFLRQESSDSYHGEDDDNMSFELKRLNECEELLRDDLERVDKSDSLPCLCSGSELGSQGSTGTTANKSFYSHVECRSNSSFKGNGNISSKTTKESTRKHNVEPFYNDWPTKHSLIRSTATRQLKSEKKRTRKSRQEFNPNNLFKVDTNDTLSTNLTSGSDSTCVFENKMIGKKSISTKPSREGTDISIEIFRDEDLIDLMASLLFGCNDYTIRPILITSYSKSTFLKRNAQGTLCVYASSFIIIYGWKNEATCILNHILISIMLATIFTILQVMLPHNINETNIAALILGIHYTIEIFSTNHIIQ